MRRAATERFAYDSYRRFIQMYGNVVLDIDPHKFEDILERAKTSRKYTLDTQMKAADWRDVVEQYLALVDKTLGRPFPQDVHEQLWGAIGAVFGSWMNHRAITYRKLNDIPGDWGTAVNVQAMVFGNMGDDCCTGVAFTRNPSTGENAFYGEYLVNAQGEDVVAGIRTPQHLTVKGKKENGSSLPAMEEIMSDVFHQLNDVRLKLEKHYHDMQDIEFTVQQGKLYMLQTRTGKRTAAAALKVAVDMVNEGLISKPEAVGRIDPASLDQLLHPTLDPKAKKRVIGKGLPASPGAASGKVVFSADEAEEVCRQRRESHSLPHRNMPRGYSWHVCRQRHRHQPRRNDQPRGGRRAWYGAFLRRGRFRDVYIDYAKQQFFASGVLVKAGDVITIDGTSGEVLLGEMPTVQPELSGDFVQLMEWADGMRRMKVRANAETPSDARAARKFGAEGIGLCRTEHMFFDNTRIIALREMIVADDEQGRRAALAKLEPFQKQDFVELFTIMEGLPVTIRLLDPPLHEFLPKTDAEIDDVARAAGADIEMVRRRANVLHEANPMLGHRGCRLGISYPEIYEMQARAIFTAAAEVQKQGKTRFSGNHDPAGIHYKGVHHFEESHRSGRRRGRKEVRYQARLSGRHDDRIAACGASSRGNRQDGAVLQLWHQ